MLWLGHGIFRDAYGEEVVMIKVKTLSDTTVKGLNRSIEIFLEETRITNLLIVSQFFDSKLFQYITTIFYEDYEP